MRIMSRGLGHQPLSFAGRIDAELSGAGQSACRTGSTVVMLDTWGGMHMHALTLPRRLTQPPLAARGNQLIADTSATGPSY